MKKIIEYSFIIFLVCFSFFYTDKVIDMVKKRDPLMIQINELKSKYNILPVNAITCGDTIIPGIKGRAIDIDKSYENMKNSKIFREEALIFKDLYPSERIVNNKDKYIIKGSGRGNNISLVYILNTKYINDVKKIDNLTLFINHQDLTIEKINNLKEKEIYTYGNNNIYNEEQLTNDNALINRLSNNKSNYCISQNKNDEILKVCSSKNMYTVIPNINGNYYQVKKQLSSGSIILLNNLNNIEVLIKYIKSKGYNIVPLSKLLSE